MCQSGALAQQTRDSTGEGTHQLRLHEEAEVQLQIALIHFIRLEKKTWAATQTVRSMGAVRASFVCQALLPSFPLKPQVQAQPQPQPQADAHTKGPSPATEMVPCSSARRAGLTNLC